MTSHLNLLILVFAGQYFICDSNLVNRNCSTSELYSCSDGEICTQISGNSTLGVCSCPKSLVRAPLTGVCEPADQHYSQDFSSGVSASAIAVGLLVPAISILIIGTLVLVGRRYRWVHRFREQAHQLTVRNYDNVLVNNEEDNTVG